ncbi:MAG: hypothetical protein M0R37_12015 [Bacteroidales bacterium]|jgi:ubiquitin-protein ligase|nr:hypothetical protein [Sphaerochaeta sp.]MCK9629300.1 hypothetical protein [Bacteroidales bacterium]
MTEAQKLLEQERLADAIKQNVAAAVKKNDEEFAGYVSRTTARKATDAA